MAVLGCVSQLSDIAGPCVVDEAGHGLLGKLGRSVAVLGCELVEEVVGEEGDVVAPRAERGDLELHDGEAVVEVFAEAAGCDLREEVSVGGGDDAGIELEVAVAAYPLELAVLEGAEELGLHAERELADFVEEDDAAVGGFEEAGLLHFCVGEGAPFVAEEGALDEGLGDGGAVDFDEGLFAARAAGVDGAGDEVFAGSRLTGDEDGGGIDALEPLEGVEEGEHAA